jgi:hypothetical protein
MEAELREGVMATLDAIAGEFESFRLLQEKLVSARLQGDDLSAADRKAYQTATGTIVQHLKTLKLNNNRIEALVEQLYAINKRLMVLEGRLLRLADSYGISRTEFLKAYMGQEMRPDWSTQVKTLGVRWTKFAENDAGQVGDRGAGYRDRRADRRLPPDRPDRSEGRARSASGQEGNGRGQPAPGDLDRQEVHQPRPAVPGPDPGRQHRPDEGGR